MDETFLGGVASQKLGRLTGSNFSNGFLVHGYGIFFTTKRLIGFTYRKITFIAYLIPFFIGVLWIGILASWIAWANGVDPSGMGSPLPYPVYVMAPLLIGPPVLVAAFVVYLSPRRVRMKIERQKPTSLTELTRRRPDLSLERADISQVTVDRNPDYRFPHPRTTFTMRTGQQYSFDIGRPEFFTILGAFCELDPPISASYIARKRDFLTGRVIETSESKFKTDNAQP
jgi:hypothetical protein